jgi:hypothetical protein
MYAVLRIGGVLFASTAALLGEIREFALPTVERLGNELSHRDEIAARAADLTWERHPEWKKVSPQCWITDIGRNTDAVYMIGGRGSKPILGYKVLFPKGGQPSVLDVRGQSLPPQIAIRYNALQTAVKAVSPRLNAAYGAHYNFEVLNDPDGSGFLVYALAAFAKPDEIYTGGHFRITVAANGVVAERIDDLSTGIARLPEPRTQVVAIVSTQMAGNTPIETWLYSSHLYHLPVYLGTKNGSEWLVWNGKIHKFTKAELDAIESKEKRK